MKIAIVANTAWYVANFRLSLMQALRDDGHDVVAISPPGPDVDRIRAEGFSHHAFALSGKGTNPFKEGLSLWALRRVLRREQFDIVLSYTPKGNIYTALARTNLGCRQVANVSGLGSSFIRQNWLTKLVFVLYRLAFRRVEWVFFQNRDDHAVFKSANLINSHACEIIPGSGVNLKRFNYLLDGSENASPVLFLLVARLLGDKGVREFAEAARLLRQSHPKVRCQLLGELGEGNPTAITQAELQEWLSDGRLEYLGYHADVLPFMRSASCIVLPSYREGMPRTLLEGGAIGRPLIATDVPGCKDTIEDEVNGYLCKVRDVPSLLDAMVRMADLTPAERCEMGRASRKKMETEFSESVVIDRYRAAISRLSIQNKLSINSP